MSDNPPVATVDPVVADRLAALEQWVWQQQSRQADVRANPPATVGPFTNVPAPGSPIRSDWPQATAGYLSDSARFRNGTASGGTVNNGTALDIATITIPAAISSLRAQVWVVHYSVLLTAAAAAKVNLKLYDPAGTAIWLAQYDGIALRTVSWAKAVSAPGAYRVSLENVTGTAVPVSTFADPVNHTLFAVQGWTV